MQINKSIRWAQSLIILLAVSLSACSGKATVTPEAELASQSSINPVVSATGVVLPAKRSIMSVSIPGLVDEVMVQKGDQVKNGQVLVRLKGKEELLAAITEAQLELISAEQELDNLYKDHDVALAASLAAYSVANNEVKEAQYQLDNFTVPVTQVQYDAIEGVKVMKERLDKARDAFEPYRNDSEFSETRKDLKQKLDDAQAEYNSAVKRLTYEFTLQEAEAKLAKAQRDYETESKGPDPDLVNVAQARVDNAKAAVAAAQQKMDDLEIKALFDGTVSDINVRSGEWISPGQPILSLGDLNHLRVETTDLNEIDVARVKVGDRVTVTFDALPDVTVEGKVTLIAPKASEGSGVNYTVEIELDKLSEDLRWGMTAFVDIEVGK